MSVPASLARATLRQSTRLPTRVARRCESTTAKATETVKDMTSKVQSKASEGLTKVSSGAGSTLSSAAEKASSTLNQIGGRTGQMIKAIESAIPPTVYYTRVGLELGKLVVQGQKMSPPSISTFQSYFQRAVKGMSNPSSFLSSQGAASPEAIIKSASSVTSTQLAAGAVIFAELLGFFTLGEVIGRFKLIGYHNEEGHENGALNEHP